MKTAAVAQKLQRSAVEWGVAGTGHSHWACGSVISSVCFHSYQQHAAWGVLAHSVVVVAAAAELVPLVRLLAACCSALGHLELVLMSVLVLAGELGPELELGPDEPEPETEVEVRRIWVILVSALMDVPLHQLSHFDLDFVLPCTEPCGQP